MPLYTINLFLYKFLYKFSYKIICTSEHMKNDLINILGNNIKNKTTVIYNFVDNNKLKTLVKKKKLNKNRKIILTSIGRLHKQKGVDSLIQHFIKFKYENLILIIIGNGAEKQNLKKLVKQSNIKNIKFKDNTNNILFWLINSDYFVLSSRWEGMPNVLLEALDCGTNVIDFSNLHQLDEVFNNLNQEAYIKASFNKKILHNELKHADKKSKISLLPSNFKIDQNLQKLEKLFYE